LSEENPEFSWKTAENSWSQMFTTKNSLTLKFLMNLHRPFQPVPNVLEVC
jgi:hypothetical protein